jgi:hypothetical protein
LPDDDSNLVDVQSEDGSGSIRAKTTWTVLLYLTSAVDGVVGGETVFYPHDRKSAREELVIAPETGMLLLHKHGEDCLLVSWLSLFYTDRHRRRDPSSNTTLTHPRRSA